MPSHDRPPKTGRVSSNGSVFAPLTGHSHNGETAKLSQDVATLLKLHHDVKLSVEALLTGQREMSRILASSLEAAKVCTGNLDPTLKPSSSSLKDLALENGLEDEGVKTDMLKDGELVGFQARRNRRAATGRRPSVASISSMRATEALEVSSDDEYEEAVLTDKLHESTSVRFASEQPTSGGPARPRRRSIAMSLSPNWPATVRRRQAFTVTEAFDFEGLSNQLPGSGPGWSSDRIASNLALQTPTKSTWRTLHPGGNTRFVMDLFGLATLFYDLWVVPFILAWDVNDDWTAVCSYLSICYWVVDLLLNFVTGFHRFGEVEMRLREIAHHYMKSMFLPDLSILLVDIIATLSDVREGRLLRAAKVGKLVRMLRVARLLNVVERVEHMTTIALPVELQALLQIIELLVLIVWVNHLLCCCWWTLGQSATGDTGMSWIQTEIRRVDSNGVTTDPRTYSEMSILFQYTTSLHWSMVQMTPGSMEVQPLNSYERCYNILCLIFGIIFFSSLISSLSAVTTHMRLLKSEQVMKLKSLRKFLNQRQVDRRTQLSIMKQVSVRLSAQRPLVQEDVTALECLSDTLRRELHFEMLVPHIMMHGFFRLVVVVNSHTAMSLCSEAMDFLIRSEGDTVFFPDFAATGAMLLTHGSLEYQQFPSTSRVECARSTRVDAGTCLAEAGLWTLWRHVGQCDTLTICEVISVSSRRLAQVVRTHHALRHIAAEYCRNFHARLVSAFPPHAAWPTDLQVPLTTFREIVMAASTEVRLAIGQLSIEMLCKNFMWHWRLPKHKVEKLAKEISSGCAVLVPCDSDPRRCVERLMAVVQLEVKQDQKTLVELGRLEDADVGLEPKCQCPFETQLVGELPSTALTRLISKRFSTISRHLTIVESKQEVWCDTNDVRLRTRYMSNIYVATLDVRFEDVAHVSDFQKATKSRAFLVKEDDVTIVCAWLESDVMQRLQTPSAAAELKALADAALEDGVRLSTVSAV